jgi:hypothetical protein
VGASAIAGHSEPHFQVRFRRPARLAERTDLAGQGIIPMKLYEHPDFEQAMAMPPSRSRITCL